MVVLYAVLFAAFVWLEIHAINNKMRLVQLLVAPICVMFIVAIGYELFGIKGNSQGDYIYVTMFMMLAPVATILAFLVLYKTIKIERKIDRISSLLEGNKDNANT